MENCILYFFVFLLSTGSGLCNDDDGSAPSVDSPLFHEFPSSESQEDSSSVASSYHPDEIMSEVTSRLPYSFDSKDDRKSNETSSISTISELTGIKQERNETNKESTNLHAVGQTSNETMNIMSLPEVPTEVDVHSENYTYTPSSDVTTKSPTVNVEDRLGRYTIGSPIAAVNFLQPTESAAILAAVFIAVALIGYFGLVLWRRVLEKRYGNRELLVNEEFYDVNDLKYFEL